MTVNDTTAAIASAEGSHGPLKNTNTTSQSSANGSSMSTDHSLLVGVSQTPVQSSGGLSSKYNVYIDHHECTWHGDGAIEQYEDDKGRTKRRCTLCEHMDEEEKAKWLKKKKQANVKSSKYKSKMSEPISEPPSQPPSTQQLHAASATSTGGTFAAEAGAEVTASSELEHVDNGEEVELEVTAELVERTQSEYFDRSPFVLEVTASATSTGQSVNPQYQLDADSYDYYVHQPGHGKNGTDNRTR